MQCIGEMELIGLPCQFRVSYERLSQCSTHVRDHAGCASIVDFLAAEISAVAAYIANGTPMRKPVL